MSLRGQPDWSRPIEAGGGALFAAFEEPRRAWALPVALEVASDPDGAPALALELIRLTGGAQGPRVFGLLTIRFAAQYALAERQAELFATHPDVKLARLAPRGGFLRFRAAEALDLPQDLLQPQPLLWAGAGSLTFATQLGQAATTLVDDAVAHGLATVTAVAEVEAWGLASRVPARARFDPARLAEPLAAVGTDGRSTAAAVAAALLALGDTPDLALLGVSTDAERIAAVTAVAERLIGRFGALAPAADPAAGATFVVDLTALRAGDTTWDLADEVLVPRGMVLASNPLETARQAVEGGFAMVREAPVIAFATGLHVLSVYANLPPRRIGVLTLGAEVRVPPFAPDRPHTVTGSVTFREGELAKTLPLRLSAAEPVAFDYHAVAFVRAAGGAQRLIGPLLHHRGLHLTLPPDSFPVRFVRVEATRALLAVVDLRLRCSGRRGADDWRAEARLDRASGAIAVAVPPDVTDGVLEVTADALDGSRSLTLEPRDLEDCWLDLASFPTAGPACVDIACTFDDGAGLTAIECVPEDRADDPDAVGLVRMTPANPTRQWRWLVVDPLRDGFRWRWFRAVEEAAAPWSPRVEPAAGPLVLRSSERARTGPTP